MSVTSPDFESGAYTDFATPALEFRMIKLPSHLVNPWRAFCIHYEMLELDYSNICKKLFAN